MERVSSAAAQSTMLQLPLLKKCVFALTVMVFAVCLPQAAYAFTLDSSDSSAEANHGFTWEIDESGSLYVWVPNTATYTATFADGVVDSELIVPSTMNGVTVKSCATAKLNDTGKKGVFGPDGTTKNPSNRSIQYLVLPGTLESIYSPKGVATPFKAFSSLTSISFSDVPSKLTFIGCEENMRYSPLPSTLTQFNAQTIDGVEYSCVVPASLESVRGGAFSSQKFTSIYFPNGNLGDYQCLINPYNSVNKNIKTLYCDNDIWPSEIITGKDSAVENLTVTGDIKNVGALSLASETLRSVTVSKSIESIDENAFKGCINLEEFKLLEDASIPATVAEVDAKAFQNCTKLTTVELPSAVTSIGNMAFAGCTSLESVTLNGENLLSIGYNAFNGDTALKTLTIPDSVTSIGFGAFANTGIEQIILPANLWQDYKCGEGGNFNKDPINWEIQNTRTGEISYGANLFCEDGETLTGSGIGMANLMYTKYRNYTLKSVDMMSYKQSYIPYYMFAGCAALTEIRVPASVSTVYEGAFADCDALTKAYFYNQNPQLAGASSSSDTGTTTGGEGGWKEVYPSVFGMHAEADSDNVSDANVYVVRDDLTLYGIGFAQNSLIAYAEKYDCKFVPFAFLGDGGKSDTVKSLFGYEMPANAVNVSDIDISANETPVISLSYQDKDISRTLTPGTDCTVVYKNASGEEVDITSLQYNGTYTATITGDDDSVWGTTTVSFKVSGGEDPKPVTPSDGGNQGGTVDQGNGGNQAVSGNGTNGQVSGSASNATANGFASTADMTPVMPVAVVASLAAVLAGALLIARKRLGN